MDAYAGFLHRDRPGRTSLALDLMEELRSVYADRFVLTLINNRIITAKDFKQMENGAVWLNEEGRRTLLSRWQERKREIITHPFLQERSHGGSFPMCSPSCFPDIFGMILTATRRFYGSDAN